MRYSLALTVILLIVAGSEAQQPPTYKPSKGYVPDAATAVKIAEAVLTPVYGEKQVLAERPYKAQLKNGVWTVSGTLHCPSGEICGGGTAEVRLAKDDGRILGMIHYK